MTTIREIIRRKSKELDEAGVSDALLSVEWIVQDELGLTRAGIVSHAADEIDASREARIDEKVARRLKREPVQYIVGYTSFMGYRISVGPGVLVPRPETEELVELVLASMPTSANRRVLDIGTGSGCISIAIKSLRPQYEVIGIDISAEAVVMAKKNAVDNACSIRFIHADATDSSLPREVGASSVDVVVSNPPYIDWAERSTMQAEVRDFEPDVALFAEYEGTAVFAASLPNIAAVLVPDGVAFFEVHADRAARFSEILLKAGFRDVQLHKDIHGRDRMLSCRRPRVEHTI